MAEIRVQPRKKDRGWVWLVLLLLAVIVAAVVYYLYSNGSLNFAGAATDMQMWVASAAPSAASPSPGGLNGST